MRRLCNLILSIASPQVSSRSIRSMLGFIMLLATQIVGYMLFRQLRKRVWKHLSLANLLRLFQSAIAFALRLLSSLLGRAPQ